MNMNTSINININISISINVNMNMNRNWRWPTMEFNIVMSGQFCAFFLCFLPNQSCQSVSCTAPAIVKWSNHGHQHDNQPMSLMIMMIIMMMMIMITQKQFIWSFWFCIITSVGNKQDKFQCVINICGYHKHSYTWFAHFCRKFSLFGGRYRPKQKGKGAKNLIRPGFEWSR